MEILRTTPSSILVGYKDMAVKLFGESFARGYGSPDFIIHSSSVTHGSDVRTGQEIALTDAERDEIILFVLTALRKKGWSIESE